MKKIISIMLVFVMMLALASCAEAQKPDWQTSLDLGQKYLLDGNYEQAIIEFNKVIEIEPKNVEAYIGLAEAYAAQGDYESAISVLEQGFAETENQALVDRLNELKKPMSIQSDDMETDIFDASAVDSSDNSEPKIADITWTLENGILTVMGDGMMPDYFGFNSPWLDEADEITSISLSEGLLSIGSEAFYGCRNLESIDIPSNIDSIYSYAFEDCENLKYVTIPEGITQIEANAFSGCSNLITITLPSSLTNIINGNPFQGCVKLESIFVDENNPAYCSSEGVLYSKSMDRIICYPAGRKGESYIIPDSVQTIGDASFEQCVNLTSIVIPESVTCVETLAFSGCQSLYEITFPNSIHEMGEHILSYCSNLSSVTLNENISSIPRCMLDECISLSSIVLPESVTSIEDAAFYKCRELKEVYLPKSLISIGYSAFEGCSILENIHIPDSVKYIDGNAFCNCKKLSNIDLPNGIEKIGSNVFNDCEEITSINIPSSVSEISDGAFMYCTNLKTINVAPDNTWYCSDDGILFNKDKTELLCYPTNKEGSHYTIPEGVVIIGYGAFFWPNNLKSISIPNSVTTLKDFSMCGLSISVPESVVEIGMSVFSDTYTIHVVSGSYAEQYAIENGLKYTTE